MPTRSTITVLLAALLFAQTIPALAGDGGFDLAKRINLSLEDAAAADVLSTFASLANAEPDIDPAVDGSVTIQLQGVSVRTTLDALCEMLDCSWRIAKGPPRRFVIRKLLRPQSREPMPAGDLDSVVNLSLANASADEVLKTVAALGHWKLKIKRPSVTIDLEQVPVRDVLDEVCAQIGCSWSLNESGGEGILEIEWVE